MNDKDPLAAHPDCGADNPEGKASKCNCYCHKGHNRHYWTPIIKTPQPSPDGTFILMDRCKYCPDIKVKVIKTRWVGDTHKIAHFEYLLRGERSVLTAEEWLSKTPKNMDPELKRIIDQEGTND